MGSKEDMLIAAAFNRDYDSVKKFVENRDIDVNCVIVVDNGLIKSPLMAAARSGHLEMVKYLVGKGARMGRTPDEEMLPLWAAVMGNHVDIAKFLIENGASLKTFSPLDLNIFHTANTQNNRELLSLVLDHGEFNLDDIIMTSKCTPLEIALAMDYEESAQCLLEKGANYRKRMNGSGAYPILSGIAGSSIKCIKILLDFIKNKEGEQVMIEYLNDNQCEGVTALHYAYAFESTNIANLLISYGANEDIVDKKGRKPREFINIPKDEFDQLLMISIDPMNFLQKS